MTHGQTRSVSSASHTQVQVLDASGMWRRTTVKPGMCGHNSLFQGQLGDWTWETVSELCNVNVFAARVATGEPTYLAFYYYHLKASTNFHIWGLTFGDEIDVTSRLFGFGSESILTVHRVCPASSGTDGGAPLEYEEVFEHPRNDCIYVENFNRWVSRSDASSNDSLIRASPVGFEFEHLPSLPERYSPRNVYARARRNHTFLAPGERTKTVAELSMNYRLDITRDMNGVGLMYFAAYFSIIDRAILQLWRHLDRDDASFMRRVVTDQKLCYLGNANADSTLAIVVTLWQTRGTSGDIFNVVVRDRDGERPIAVSTVQMERSA